LQPVARILSLDKDSGGAKLTEYSINAGEVRCHDVLS
jgi:hypothetical protein